MREIINTAIYLNFLFALSMLILETANISRTTLFPPSYDFFTFSPAIALITILFTCYLCSLNEDGLEKAASLVAGALFFIGGIIIPFLRDEPWGYYMTSNRFLASYIGFSFLLYPLFHRNNTHVEIFPPKIKVITARILLLVSILLSIIMVKNLYQVTTGGLKRCQTQCISIGRNVLYYKPPKPPSKRWSKPAEKAQCKCDISENFTQE